MAASSDEKSGAPENPVRRDFTHDCCFNCGGASFTWGVVTGFSTALAVFTPDAPVVTPGFWSRGPQPEKLTARKCDTCGNVQLFTQPAEDAT